MVFVAALFLGFQRPDPDSVIKALVGHYRKLKSYSAKVVHNGDFLADSRESTDNLSWLAPTRFEMINDHESIPTLKCNGKLVATFIPHVVPISESLMNETGRMATWEPRGGFVLSLLMHGLLADQLLRPSRPIKVKYSYGSDLKWHDLPVSQIIANLTAPGLQEEISYYLTPDCKQVVGLELKSGDRVAWTQYKDVVENFDLPKTLGEIK